MKPIRVTVRREKATGHLALFYREAGDITMYSRADGHCEVSREYMLHQCTPVDPADPAAVRLAHFWGTIGPDPTPYIIARRL